MNYPKKIFLIFFGLILAILFLELFIRLAINFLPDNYLPTYGIYQKSSSIIGQKLVPNSKGVWSREGFSKVEINSKGWNDYERNYEKKEKIIRIAVVGDSFIEAFQVDKSNAVGPVMELWLNNNCDSISNDYTFEVLSFGASGWGTSQMYLTIRDEVILYKPDYVVLAFFPGNDLKNNIYELELNPYRPYFELKNDDLVLSRSPIIESNLKREIYRFVRDNLIIVQLIRESIVNIYWQTSLEDKIKETHSNIESMNDYEKKLKLIEDATWGNSLDSNFVMNAWELLESMLLKTSKDLAIHNSELITLIVSRAEIVDYEEDYVGKMAKSNNISNIFYPEDRLENFGKQNNIPIISISRYMSDFNWSKKIGVTKFHGFKSSDSLGTGHWNENGHKFTGEIVGEKICQIYD
jgi:hypothetical protein